MFVQDEDFWNEVRIASLFIDRKKILKKVFAGSWTNGPVGCFYVHVVWQSNSYYLNPLWFCREMWLKAFLSRWSLLSCPHTGPPVVVMVNGIEPPTTEPLTFRSMDDRSSTWAKTAHDPPEVDYPDNLTNWNSCTVYVSQLTASWQNIDLLISCFHWCQPVGQCVTRIGMLQCVIQFLRLGHECFLMSKFTSIFLVVRVCWKKSCWTSDWGRKKEKSAAPQSELCFLSGANHGCKSAECHGA